MLAAFSTIRRYKMAIGDPSLYKGYLGGHNWITHTDEGALKYIQDTFDIQF
jgi:hypothetical protein